MSEIKITDNRGKNKPAPTPMPGIDRNGKVDYVGKHRDPTSSDYPNIYRIEDDLKTLVQETIREHNVTGDKIGFVVSPTIIPGPDGQPVPILLLLLETNGVVLGEKVSATGLLPLDGGREKAVAAGVPQLLEQLQESKNADPLK